MCRLVAGQPEMPQRSTLLPYSSYGICSSVAREASAVERRAFITLLGGAVTTALPLAARAQQVGRVRRIGVLLPFSPDNAESQTRIAAFSQGLALSGWTIGRNVRIDIRWATPNAAEIRRHAA